MPDLPGHHAVYAEALNKSLEIFVSYTEKEFDSVMSNGLRPIADAADLDRIIVFRVLAKERYAAGEIYRWDKAEGGTAAVDEALKVLPVFEAMKHWISILSNDTCISLRRSEFAEDEAAFLSPRGVMSIFIVPVFTEQELWGVVTFHDNVNERDFGEACAAMLRSAARLCAATIIREEKTKAADHAMEALRRREKMAEALNNASVTLLSQGRDDFRDMMTAGVRPIADMADIGRMVLFRNNMTPGGLTMSQVYRWDRNSGGSTELNPLYSDIPYARLMPNWETFLKDGNSVNSPVRLLPETGAAIFQTFGIVSVAAIPIFMNNNFWGFAIFGDIHNERCFEDDIIEMMRSAAFLFANAFIRADMERETAEKNEFTRVIFEASPIGLTMFDENLNMFDCNNAVLNMFGTTKQCYLEQFLEFSPEYQPDGRKTIDALIDDMGRALSGETLVIEWLHNTLAGEPVPCEITLTHAKYNGKHIGMTYIYDLRNIKNLEKNIKQLETVADKIYYDPLTGIYNRRYFDENLNRIMRFLSRSGGVISLMMIDIDFFKDYNDKYGHSEGDRCLKIVAEILKNTITRNDDFVARYGGDEFVVVMPNTDEQGAKLIACKMLDNIRNRNIVFDQGHTANRATISIGVSTGKVEYTYSVEDLVRSADAMLYKSKEEGRNRCTFGSI